MLNYIVNKVLKEVDSTVGKQIDKQYGSLYSEIDWLKKRVDILSKTIRDLKKTANELVPNFDKIHELVLEVERREDRLAEDNSYHKYCAWFGHSTYKPLALDEKQYFEFRLAMAKAEIEKLKKGESKVDE